MGGVELYEPWTAVERFPMPTRREYAVRGLRKVIVPYVFARDAEALVTTADVAAELVCRELTGRGVTPKQG